MVRFPRVPGHQPLAFTDRGNDYHVRSMLVAINDCLKTPTKGLMPGLTIWLDPGEYDKGVMPGTELPVLSYINLPLKSGMTLEEALHALPDDPSSFHGMRLPEEIRTACVRLVCTLCLLDNDPELIEPDVLNRDAGKPLTETILIVPSTEGSTAGTSARALK